ncbi:response regulator [Thomasclavelia ramosa]|mgnify:FL=1|uniref:response regulator n=1 Tax=Thomasclavelia ramosa TaxID=1547 RepID=UPI0022E5C204|nr:response regulator transcription factor [Thomasclavelia ramosa]
MNNTTILIVEDDKTIQNFLKVTLKTQNYNYIIAETGLSGLSLFYANRPDLVLLDLGLPDIEGIEVLKQIRQNSSIPIIVVSARSSETEKVMALDYGSDDYVTKPFNTAELLARIRAALRHCLKEKVSEPIFELDYLKVDFERRHVWVKDQEIHLTPIEYKMLVLLITNRGKVLTHHFIQENVWGYETTDDYQSLRVFMANIRRKIEIDSSSPHFIITEVGVGYRFVE